MSIKSEMAAISKNFMMSSNYINKNGEHPKKTSSINWNQFVFKKEELNDHNWLYIGEESEEKKQGQLEALEFNKGFIPIFE